MSILGCDEMSNKPAKKTKTRERTAKQWAWEFLRRNPNYRDAFNVMSRLTSEQCGFLQALISGQVSEFDEHLNVLETFPTNIFDAKKLKGVEPKHRTLLDYLNGIGAYSEEFKSDWGGVAEHLKLVVLEKYRLETYAIENWIDPRCVELTDADEKSFGRLNRKRPVCTVLTAWRDIS